LYRAWIQRGQLAQSANRVEEAIEAYSRVLQLCPDHEQTRKALAGLRGE
jgi:hypothetical protein